MKHTAVFVLSALVLGYGVATAPSADAQSRPPVCGNPTIVCALDAPEDILSLDHGTTILASSLDIGGLYAIDAATHRVTKLDMRAIGEHPLPMYRCPSLHASGAFVTHGLNVKPAADGHYRLYVVRHGGREAIEVFQFDRGQDISSLEWLGCVLLPRHFSGNAVVGRKDGGFFVTSMEDTGNVPASVKLAMLFAARPSGAVLEWLPNRGYRRINIGSLSGPNGIELSPDEDTLYLDAWGSRSIWEITLGSKTSLRRHIDVPFMPDNLRWGDNGALFSAGVISTPRDVLTCTMKTTVGVVCARHWGAVAIDTNNMRAICHVDQSNYLNIGDVSTAMKIGGTLWLASFDNNVLGVEPLAAQCMHISQK